MINHSLHTKHTLLEYSLSQVCLKTQFKVVVFFFFYPNASIHLYTENAIVATIMSFFLFIEMIRRTHWSSTQTPPTSLTFGGRKCCKPQRTREKKRGDRRCVSIAYIYMFLCALYSPVSHCLFFLQSHTALRMSKMLELPKAKKLIPK